MTERLNLNDIINDALNVIGSDGHGNFYPVLDLQPNLPAVQCNYTQIQKVLVNLFRNAIEAMHATELPTLTITAMVLAVTDANWVTVTIQDNGSGLDSAMVRRIFEPFFTTKPTGIGMGLSISRALIETNGGKLWVDSDAELGAKFHFTLPIAP